MKKIIATALICIIVSTALFAATKDTFKPVLRFVVTSDDHILAVDEPAGGNVCESNLAWREGNIEQFGQLFQTAYKYAQNSGTSYKKVDAFIVAGDMTDDGTEMQYQTLMDIINANMDWKQSKLLICIGNHEFYDTGENGSSSSTTTKTYARFTQYTGSDPDTVNVINGYTFIGVSNDTKGGRALSKTKCEWLKEQIDAAVAKDKTGKKPIFVFTHFPTSNSVYGSLSKSASGSYDTTALEAVLKNYPQVVLFTGHYHKPSADPTSIYQKYFTAIGSCNMTYGEGEVIMSDGSHPIIVVSNDRGGYVTLDNGSYYNTYAPNDVMGTYLIIEVDKSNRLRVLCYDIKTDQLVGEARIIDSVGDKSSFTYTAMRKQNSQKPTFASDAQIKLVSATCATLQLEFPAATCADGVRNYKCVLSKGGQVVSSIYRMDMTYYYPLKAATLYAPFSNLEPDTEYSVMIYAVNSFGVWGTEYITGTFRTSKTPEKDGVCQPDVFQAVFDASNSTVTDAISGDVLEKTGSCTVAIDSRINRPAAVFNGSNSFSWNGIYDWYELLKKSLSYEVEFRMVSYPSSTVVVSGNMQHGGCGFELKSDGTLNFACYFQKSGWVNTSAKVEKGEYVHAVATYDGKSVKLYINGELAAESSVATEIWSPRMPTSLFLAIGADSELEGKTAYRFSGTVSTVNIYSYPLSATQVKAIYESK